MSNSIPTTDEVRKNYAYTRAGDRLHRKQEYFDAFDRWLAAHDAEVLRAAAAAMRSHKDPGHWNLRDEEYPADMSQSPDRWLERRADRLAAVSENTNGNQ